MLIIQTRQEEKRKRGEKEPRKSAVACHADFFFSFFDRSAYQGKWVRRFIDERDDKTVVIGGCAQNMISARER